MRRRFRQSLSKETLMRTNDFSDREGPAVENVPVRPLTRWQKFRLVVKVVELRLRFVALMAVTGLVFAYWDTLANHYEKWNRPRGDHAVAAADIEFFCPMHPSVVQAEPGNCPICGMPLSKRKKGETQALPEGVTARVQLAPFRVVQAGIRTAEVGYSPLVRELTTVGTVEFDERRLARIASKAKGLTRIEKLLVNFTGTMVKVGEPLAEVYSPELYQAAQELLLAQRRAGDASTAQGTLARSVLGDAHELIRLGRDKLRLWGLTEGQIDTIVASGRAETTLPILAPIGGVVVRKNVVEGQYVSEGDALFDLADLSHVWVQAQVYEDQVSLVQVGQPVQAIVSAFPGQVFRGTVAFIDPALNPATRTLGVRYDLDNPDGRLRPGMYATVKLKTPLPAPTTRAGDAQLHHASLSADEQQNCPVTGAKLGSMGEPLTVEVQRRKIWICCDGCAPKLKASPAKYMARLEPPPTGGVLSVPESAVIDTGDRTVVYVETEPGVFEGRKVVLGPRVGDRFPVLDGLKPGDRVAAAGAFLIDAESRLNMGASVAPAATPHPARTAAAVDPSVHRH
jgi:Cu(I)/Ag(I) efflux system membrane fusion protein